MLIMPTVILAIENENDRAYMEWIFHTYRRLMYRYITDIFSDSWLAEDAMQDSLEKLIKKIGKLREMSETKRRNYIITVAKNTSISLYRKEKRRAGCAYDDWIKDLVGTDPEDDPEELILHKDELQRLHVIWEELDQRSQFVLSSRYILEQSFEEIGKELGVAPGSVRMMLTRAKRKAIELLRS